MNIQSLSCGLPVWEHLKFLTNLALSALTGLTAFSFHPVRHITTGKAEKPQCPANNKSTPCTLHHDPKCRNSLMDSRNMSFKHPSELLS